MAPRNYRVWWSIAGLLVFVVASRRIVSDEIQLIRKIRHNRLGRTENGVKEAAKLFFLSFQPEMSSIWNDTKRYDNTDKNAR